VSPVEWSPCCPRTIHLPLTASPCGRLSRPRSTISQYDFHPVIRPLSPLRLGRSYKRALEPDGSPLFTLLPLAACWRYEPREHLRLLALARPLVPSPLRDRVGYSDHDRFRCYFPVHFIPAYNLPVYASQRPLPTQDSVQGCSLGFAAAVIAGGRLQRACKAQPAPIPASAANAPGSRVAATLSAATKHNTNQECDRYCVQRRPSPRRARTPTSINRLSEALGGHLDGVCGRLDGFLRIVELAGPFRSAERSPSPIMSNPPYGDGHRGAPLRSCTSDRVDPAEVLPGPGRPCLRAGMGYAGTEARDRPPRSMIVPTRPALRRPRPASCFAWSSLYNGYK
jgi:hypothetical protein